MCEQQGISHTTTQVGKTTRWNANTSNNNFTPDTSKQILTINII